MLTKLTIRYFKRFAEVEIELGNPVVFIGWRIMSRKIRLTRK
jgi:hypothetical protein